MVGAAVRCVFAAMARTLPGLAVGYGPHVAEYVRYVHRTRAPRAPGRTAAMMGRVISVLFAVLTALSNGSASVLQRRAAMEVPDSEAMRLSLMARLVRQKVWLAGDRAGDRGGGLPRRSRWPPGRSRWSSRSS